MAAELTSSLVAAGVAGCVADFATFPLDTAKVRLQVQGTHTGLMAFARPTAVNLSVHMPQYKGMFGTINTIARQEGASALYNGLTAGLKRQMFLASIRLGLYEPCKEFYQELFDHAIPGNSPENEFHIGCRMAAGVTTGAAAVLVAHPPDILTVRFQASPKGSGHGYSSIFGAYRKIAKREGVSGFWRGMFPNATKNALINTAEIVCYDIAKDMLLLYNIMEEGASLHFSSAVIAGFFSTVVASPVDVVKTRCMNSAPGVYKGAFDCAIKLVNNDGIRAFYKGFLPSVCRFMAWNVVMWMTYEQVKSSMTKFYDDEDSSSIVV